MDVFVHAAAVRVSVAAPFEKKTAGRERDEGVFSDLASTICGG
jgi:hypothetical protein